MLQKKKKNRLLENNNNFFFSYFLFGPSKSQFIYIMKYSLTMLFKNANLTLNGNSPPEKLAKSLYISSHKLWKFFLIYEVLTDLVNFLLVSSEFLSENGIESDNLLFKVKISLRVVQIVIIFFFCWVSNKTFKKVHFGPSSSKICVLLNGMIDLLILCHIDSKLLAFDKNQIYGFFVIFKVIIYSFFLEKQLYLNISSASFLLYYVFWNSIDSSLPRAVIYSIMILILIFGSSYFLKNSSKSDFRKEKKQKLYKHFICNPFLEIIPEGILLVKSNEDFKLVYHNQYIFKTLEVDKFFPTEIKEISQYMANFVRSKKETDSKHMLRSRSSKSQNHRHCNSFQTFNDLVEILSNLKADDSVEMGEKDGPPQYFMANRIDPSNPDQQLYQIELTIKKIYFKNEPYFIILFQSMKLKKMVQDLRDKDDFKSRLLSSFSHELKTPLNGTIPCLELLLDEDGINEELKEKYIKTSISSLKLLQSTMNDIIDYSLIGSGQFILNIKPVNIMSIIMEIGELIKPQLHAKNISFTTNFINLGQTPLLYSDSNRITQILLNLLINALKFTNSGGFIDLNVTSEIKNFVENLTFEVKDTGIGMTEGQLSEIQCYLKKIIEDSEEHLALNLNSTGCGFGLLISQTISLILGPDGENEVGGLMIESKLDEGTRARFVVSDKKPSLLESKSSLSLSKSLNRKTSVLYDSVKIEF